MAICTVSGVIQDGSEDPVEGVTVEARVVSPFFTTTIQIIPKSVTTTTNSSGAWSLELSRGGQFTVSIMYPPNAVDSARRYTYTITVPNSATANFSTLATEL